MKEYLKLAVVGLVAGLVAGLVVGWLVSNQPDLSLGGGTRLVNGLSTDTTSPSAGEVRTTSLTVTAASTLTGTSTVTQSVDGLVVGGTISTAATSTLRTIYTNTTGPKICDLDVSYLDVNTRGVFTPALIFSVGTSTGAVSTTNIIASSTVASTTDTLIQPATGIRFILDNGDRINAMMDEIDSGASSTYYSNVEAEFGVWCQDLSRTF